MRTNSVFSIPLAAAIAATSAAVGDAAILRVPKQHPTIQAAVDAAAPFDVIEVSKGTYPESVLVSSKDDLTIRARKGHKVVVEGSLVTRPLTVYESDRLVLKRLRLRTAPSSVLNLESSDDVRVDSCRIQDGNYGLYALWCGSLIVSGCRIEAVDDCGIFFKESVALVETCSIRDVGGSGVLLSTSSPITLRWNSIEGTGDHGIETGAGGILLLGNSIRDAGGDGIHLQETAQAVTVLENVIVDPLGDGIDARGAAPHAIDGNVIRGAIGQGIVVRAAGSLVGRNKVKSCADGVVVIGDGCLLVDNKTVKSSAVGFAIGSVDNSLVGNVAKKSGIVGLSDVGGDNHYMANTFDGVAY